jgi:nitrite reductase/ring-hydroxylating ferredoxin subunit
MTGSSFRSPRTSDPEPRQGRREMLIAMGRLGCLAAAGPMACALLQGCTVPVRSFRAPTGPISVPLAPYPELKRSGGLLKILLAGEGALYVRHEGDGTYAALSAICTHQGCTVEPSGPGFQCPCHGSTYDREGLNTGGPAPAPLPRYRATLRGDEVQIDLVPPT